MSRLTPINWKTLECVFLRDGFTFKRQSGSHRYYTKPGVIRPIVIPAYNTPLSTHIIRSNMRTAGMSRDRYFDLLSDC
jgi:predicted RNA binding protein YcfA (HicA-like mRNA interferase family)